MKKTGSIRGIARSLGFIAVLLLMGCGSDRLSGGGDTPKAAPVPQPAPVVDMSGRWRLTTPSGGACGLAFTGTPGAAEGTIAPEGRCPENFSTSRRWGFEQNSLVIRDTTGKTLAELRLNKEQGSYEGQAASGQFVWLAR
jgi:hypothetical protein